MCLRDRNSAVETIDCVRSVALQLAKKVRQEAKMSHKDKVSEFNQKLERQSEHHDLPRVSPTTMHVLSLCHADVPHVTLLAVRSVPVKRYICRIWSTLLQSIRSGMPDVFCTSLIL